MIADRDGDLEGDPLHANAPSFACVLLGIRPSHPGWKAIACAKVVSGVFNRLRISGRGFANDLAVESNPSRNSEVSSLPGGTSRYKAGVG
jgi:hypothetical protein